jgi:drug/metabolite transporter (DMT)-like permease
VTVDPARRLTGIALTTTGAVLWSTTGLFVRALDLDVWTTAGWRSFFAGCSLLVIAFVQEGRRLPGAIARLGRPGLVTVMLSAVSMFAFIAAVKLTTVANVMTVFATVPFVAAGLAFLMLGERASGRVVTVSAVAFAGVLMMAGGAITPRDIAGNMLSLLTTVTFAAVLVTTRRYPALNIALVNSLAAFACAAACTLLPDFTVPGSSQLGLLALFGLVSTTLAYLMFLTGGRYIPSGEAGLIGLMDSVLGPIWVWLAFGERPSLGAVVGGAVVLAAVAWYIAGEVRRTTRLRAA